MTVLSPDRPPVDLPMTILLGAAIALALLAFSIGDAAPERLPQARLEVASAVPAGPSVSPAASPAVNPSISPAISLPIGVTGPAPRLLDRQHTVPRWPVAGAGGLRPTAASEL
jgi:hypothetical protein